MSFMEPTESWLRKTSPPRPARSPTPSPPRRRPASTPHQHLHHPSQRGTHNILVHESEISAARRIASRRHGGYDDSDDNAGDLSVVRWRGGAEVITTPGSAGRKRASSSTTKKKKKKTTGLVSTTKKKKKKTPSASPTRMGGMGVNDSLSFLSAADAARTSSPSRWEVSLPRVSADLGATAHAPHHDTELAQLKETVKFLRHQLRETQQRNADLLSREVDLRHSTSTSRAHSPINGGLASAATAHTGAPPSGAAGTAVPTSPDVAALTRAKQQQQDEIDLALAESRTQLALVQAELAAAHRTAHALGPSSPDTAAAYRGTSEVDVAAYTEQLRVSRVQEQEHTRQVLEAEAREDEATQRRREHEAAMRARLREQKMAREVMARQTERRREASRSPIPIRAQPPRSPRSPRSPHSPHEQRARSPPRAHHPHAANQYTSQHNQPHSTSHSHHQQQEQQEQQQRAEFRHAARDAFALDTLLDRVEERRGLVDRINDHMEEISRNMSSARQEMSETTANLQRHRLSHVIGRQGGGHTSTSGYGRRGDDDEHEQPQHHQSVKSPSRNYDHEEDKSTLPPPPPPPPQPVLMSTHTGHAQELIPLTAAPSAESLTSNNGQQHHHHHPHQMHVGAASATRSLHSPGPAYPVSGPVPPPQQQQAYPPAQPQDRQASPVPLPSPGPARPIDSASSMSPLSSTVASTISPHRSPSPLRTSPSPLRPPAIHVPGGPMAPIMSRPGTTMRVVHRGGAEIVRHPLHAQASGPAGAGTNVALAPPLQGRNLVSPLPPGHIYPRTLD